MNRKRMNWKQIKEVVRRRNPTLYSRIEGYNPDEDAERGGHAGLGLADAVERTLRKSGKPNIEAAANVPLRIKGTIENPEIDWPKLTVKAAVYPAFKLGVGIEANRRLLIDWFDSLKQMGFPVYNYGHMNLGEQKRYAGETRAKILREAQTRCPKTHFAAVKYAESAEKARNLNKQ